MAFPSAWYALCLSSELPLGASRRVALLSTEMTATRDDRGGVHVVEAGTNREVPVAEVNTLVLVWHGRSAPTFEVEPLPELSSPAWRPIRWRTPAPFATTVQNVMRDVVDNHHFEPVHGLIGAQTEAWSNGPFLDTVSQGVIDTSRFFGPRLLAHLRIAGRLNGLGLLAYRMTVTMGTQLHYITLSAATPIDDRTVRIHLAIAMKRSFGPADRWVEGLVLDNYALNFEHDRVHWESPAGRLAPGTMFPEEAHLLERFDHWAVAFA